MDEEFAMDDTTQLLDSASDFAYHPGVQNDAAAKEFLDRFPLPVIINVLQTKSDLPGLETALVTCLERIFKTKYGASLIPHYMAFVQVGLRADSQEVKCLACKTVTCFLEHSDQGASYDVDLLIEYEIYPLLLECLIDGNEQVATASMDAIKKLAGFPKGIDIIFPDNNSEATHLGNLATQCSSLGRVRVLSLIVKLFSVSRSVASVIYKSNLLTLLEEGVSNTNDTLVTLSILELLYELAEIQHGTEFLSRTTLLQLLCSIIGNSTMETILRSRAMMISGRLLSREDTHMFIDESSIKTVISAIDGRLGFLETQDTDECESALEALGQIGSSIQGASLLLLSLPPAARHVIDAAFNRQGRGKQLAALHVLANIAGETRPEDKMNLSASAEENLRRLIYEVASRSSKLTPSGLFLSVLQQAAEIRLAGYRMVTGLVARPWCLMELCSKQEVINIVTDATTETTKIGMEARYNCCKAIRKAFNSSKLISDPAFAGIAEKLEEAVRRGPYLARKNVEAQPVVMTEQRF
ncbi:ARM repeat superfamily protein [Melia azedarach]|uniref:ARM repeat superfamily protein n=2 Tax=Melia azedarach TaxID=155640 RepID=A0ACC1YUR7_MELAZ|nr:ARM repeat superfamily protein [Melia azedarach]KAJ4726361.1 ARM repeat superfamily protein [Melia azedarach]